MCRHSTAFVLLALAVFVLSCSGGINTPVQPGSEGGKWASKGERTESTGGSQLWGLWDVSWNPSKNTFEAVPLRSAMFALNAIKFINASPSNLIIKVNSIQPETDHKDFDLDIGLKHPFPGLDMYTGFDVMGVFMGEGSGQYPGSKEFHIAGPNDQQLLNPDGYTRRFNATEYTGAGQIMPLQGYFPGAKGNAGYSPTAVLNPYKYYADGLDANEDLYTFLGENDDSRGIFKAGSVNYRKFLVRMPNTLLKFQYAVLANWEPNVNHPKPPGTIDDFPASANSEEAVAISVVDMSDAYYVSETVYGGDIGMSITPWDWSATASDVMEEYSIRLYSSAWTGPYDVYMTPIAQAEHRYTFSAKLPAETLTSSGALPVWIEVSYPGHDFTSPIGVPNDATGPLTVYFKTQVNVLSYDPMDPSIEFIYGFADGEFFTHADQGDNYVLFTNMLNLPLTGSYAQNKKVMYYEGRSNDLWGDFQDFASFVQDLGYDWELVEWNHDPVAPPLLDTTGVKMLMLSTILTNDSIAAFSPLEIQAVKDLLNGGGICVIVFENSHCFKPPHSTHLIDQVLDELHPDFNYPFLSLHDCDPYVDFTTDPILQGVNAIYAGGSGEFTVFGDAVSLVRGKDEDTGAVYTTICKSPWKG
jgi:hypothetical protein